MPNLRRARAIPGRRRLSIASPGWAKSSPETAAFIVSGVLVLVIIGIFMALAVFVGGAVLSVVAAVRSGCGESYRYPLTIRFLH